MLKVRIQEEKHVELLKTGKQAKHRIEELAPEIRLKEKGKCCICFESSMIKASIHLNRSLKTSLNWYESRPLKFTEFKISCITI